MNTKFFKKCSQGIVNLYGGQYGKVKKILPEVKPFHFVASESLKYDTNGDYCIDKETGTGWLLIKGTDRIEDWFSNFRLCKRRIPYRGVNPKIKVHTGFYEGYILIREWFLETFKDCEQINILSHSRGVPIACLAAVDMQYNYGKDNIIVMGEGCPRFANKWFHRSYKNRVPNTFIFRKGLDIVSFVPPILYSYFKNFYKIGKASWPIWNVSDHYPIEYLKAMKDFKC